MFDNGCPVGATDWIADGRLTNLVRTAVWAARTGAEPRPPSSNLILDGGGTSADARAR